MQRGRGAVEADIGGDGAGCGARVERLGLRDLVDEAALGQNVKKIGLIGAHCWALDAACRLHGAVV